MTALPRVPLTALRRRLGWVLRAMVIVMLVITGQQLALARGAAAGSQTAVICGGQGLALVTLDAQGRPAQDGHFCPDGLLAFGGAGGPALLSLHAARLRPAQRLRPARPARVAVRPRRPFHARAPPLVC